MRAKKWNGLCPDGKHGLDYRGQRCDQCHPPEPPRISTTVVDTLDLACVVNEMDRCRRDFVKLLRDVGEDLVRIAGLVEKHGLDSQPTEMCGVSPFTLDQVSRGFATLDAQRELLRGVLGWSGHGHALDKLEEHPQIKKALTEYQAMYRSRS